MQSPYDGTTFVFSGSPSTMLKGLLRVGLRVLYPPRGVLGQTPWVARITGIAWFVLTCIFLLGSCVIATMALVFGGSDAGTAALNILSIPGTFIVAGMMSYAAYLRLPAGTSPFPIDSRPIAWQVLLAIQCGAVVAVTALNYL